MSLYPENTIKTFLNSFPVQIPTQVDIVITKDDPVASADEDTPSKIYLLYK